MNSGSFVNDFGLHFSVALPLVVASLPGPSLGPPGAPDPGVASADHTLAMNSIALSKPKLSMLYR